MEKLSVPKEILPVLAVFGIYACSSPVPIIEIPTAAPTRTPEPTATFVPTRTPMPASTPIRIEPTSTRTPIRIEPTPNLNQAIDLENRLKIEQLKSGETTILENVFISRIIRTPMIGVGSQGKEAYIAILGAEGGSNFDAVFRGDCIRDSFSLQELGPAFDIPLTRFATWDVNKRIPRLTVEAGYLIKAVETSRGGVNRDCHVGEITQETEALFRQIPWRELPREAGRLLGFIAGEFARGIREGFNQPTPRPTNKIVLPLSSTMLI